MKKFILYTLPFIFPFTISCMEANDPPIKDTTVSSRYSLEIVKEWQLIYDEIDATQSLPKEEEDIELKVKAIKNTFFSVFSNLSSKLYEQGTALKEAYENEKNLLKNNKDTRKD